MLELDPDPDEMNADPQPWSQEGQSIVGHYKSGASFFIDQTNSSVQGLF
jgi:hypothetical protein